MQKWKWGHYWTSLGKSVSFRKFQIHIITRSWQIKKHLKLKVTGVKSSTNLQKRVICVGEEGTDRIHFTCKLFLGQLHLLRQSFIKISRWFVEWSRALPTEVLQLQLFYSPILKSISSDYLTIMIEIGAVQNNLSKAAARTLTVGR